MPESELGEYLRGEIGQRGWTVREAARQIGMGFSTLQRVLTSSGTPELATLQKIAQGLGLPLARLQDLSGYAPDREAAGDLELRGLTDEQRAFLRGLSPERKRQLIDAIRQFLGE